MNQIEAKKILAKIRQRKLADGTDLKVAIAETDIAAFCISLLLFIAFTTSLSTSSDPDSTEIIIRTFSAVILIAGLIYSFFFYKKMRSVRDYIVSYRIQNLEELDD